MKEINQYLFIAKLICKERIIGLDDSERRQLDSWRNESKEVERVFAKNFYGRVRKTV